MNITLKPIERCFLDFEYYKKPCHDDNWCKIKWLGFDKYGCLIYGIRDLDQYRNPVDVVKKEIVMLSIFKKEINVIKRFNLPLLIENILYVRLPETCSISSTGDEIAIVRFYCPYRNDDDEVNSNHIFYLFAVGTGEMEKFKLYCDFRLDLNWYIGYFVYHCSSLGWVFVNGCRNPANEEMYFIHRLTFDHSNKTCKLEYLMETFNNMNPLYTFPYFGESEALFFPKKGDCLNVYNYQSKSWTERKLYNFPSMPRYFEFRLTRLQQNVFCITSQKLNIDDTKDCSLYRLVGSQWEKMPISLLYKIECEFPRSSIHYSFCSSNLLFLDIQLNGAYNDDVWNALDEEDEQVKKIGLCVAIDVLPLKLLAMKQIFVNYEQVSRKELIKRTDLPHMLKRQYFGPSWIKQL